MRIRACFTAMLLVFVGLLPLSAQSDEQAEKTKMLTDFYTAYITEICEFPIDLQKVDRLVKKYGTPQLIKQLWDPDVDYDLLIGARDGDPEWLKTLTVAPDSANTNQFSVSFTDLRGNTKEVKLLLVKNQTLYKIDKVIR